MAKNLNSLIRLHQWIVDEKRRKLGDLLKMVQDLEARAKRLEEELIEEQKIARNAPEQAGLTYGGYAKVVIDRRERLALSIAGVEKQIAVAREELNEAYRDLKKYEVAQDIRDRREAEEAARKDQIILDDIGLQGFRQRSRA